MDATELSLLAQSTTFSIYSKGCYILYSQQSTVIAPNLHPILTIAKLSFSFAATVRPSSVQTVGCLVIMFAAS